ncbi:hypothetical protein OTK49_01925 [Vibrio coralliirubri]|uniref:hypothetical protein n=1 Tax=Vibrio coralliirubri TaxID=1516159 RepID=UPI002284DB6D|nr:hypothetical protein [Vibrio coralliirubri]MCY9861272.1 hypothetical protein [Vibrio coralliirubri]
MFKPTLKKEEVIFIKDEVLKKTSLSLTRHVVAPINEESIGKLGASAHIHMLFKVTLPRDVVKLYKPTREMEKGTILKSLTLSEIFISKTTGLPILSGGEIYVLKSVEYKGASSPSLSNSRIVIKNEQANTEVHDMVNSDEFKTLVSESAGLAKKAIGYSIDQQNESLIARHKLRFPSFVYKVLNNQKSRSLGTDSKELTQYNGLVERISEHGTASLSKDEANFVRSTNQTLILGLNDYVKDTRNFNFDKLDSNYRTLLTKFIDALSPKDLRMTLTDEKSLLRICNNWKVS